MHTGLRVALCGATCAVTATTASKGGSSVLPTAGTSYVVILLAQCIWLTAWACFGVQQDWYTPDGELDLAKLNTAIGNIYSRGDTATAKQLSVLQKAVITTNPEEQEVCAVRNLA